MTQVLERLTTLKAPIDMVRRHGAEEFHRTNIEESDKAEIWFEKLQRILEEVSALLIKEHHVQSHYCRVRHMIGRN